MATVQVRYIVNDVDEAIAFYCQHLGFTEVMHPAPTFAMLTRGGIPVDAFTPHVTKDIVQILQATIILFVAAEGFFRGTIGRFGLLRRSKA